MAFDGMVTKLIAKELETGLIDGKINKVYQPNKNEIILGIYAEKKNLALQIVIASNSCRLNLTTTSKVNPMVAPSFCMLLRKYLIGGRIKRITTFDLERIVIFDLECLNELNDRIHRKLIVELLGKHSNCILVNENNRIIDSMRHIEASSESYRDIMPAREYSLPTSSKISIIDYDNSNLDELMKNFNNITSFFTTNFTGISKSLITCTLKQLNIENEDYTKNNIQNVVEFLQKLNIFIEKRRSTSCIYK